MVGVSLEAGRSSCGPRAPSVSPPPPVANAWEPPLAGLGAVTKLSPADACQAERGKDAYQSERIEERNEETMLIVERGSDSEEKEEKL